MTRELRNFAKNRIEYLIKISPFVFDEPDREALEMAIQALSQEPQEPTFDDVCQKDMNEMWEKVKTEHDPCETCGYVEGSPFCLQYCPYDAERKKEQEPCDDAVEDDGNRNQSNACSILDDECPYPHKHCWECPLNYQYELAKHELDKNVDLPSVSQKSGKWIVHEKPHGIRYLECSHCNSWYLNEHLIRNSYCPNCGARMESEVNNG